MHPSGQSREPSGRPTAAEPSGTSTSATWSPASRVSVRGCAGPRSAPGADISSWTRCAIDCGVIHPRIRRVSVETTGMPSRL